MFTGRIEPGVNASATSAPCYAFAFLEVQKEAGACQTVRVLKRAFEQIGNDFDVPVGWVATRRGRSGIR